MPIESVAGEIYAAFFFVGEIQKSLSAFYAIRFRPGLDADLRGPFRYRRIRLDDKTLKGLKIVLSPAGGIGRSPEV